MLSSLKARLALFFITFMTLSIFTSLLIGSFIANQKLEANIQTQSNLIYKIDSSSQLKALYGLDSFEKENLITFEELLSTNTSKQGATLIVATMSVFIVISSLFLLLFNKYYDAIIAPLLKIESSQVDEFAKVKEQIEDKDDQIAGTNAQMVRINNYVSHELKNSLAVLRGKIVFSPDSVDDYISEINDQIDDINALTTNRIENYQQVDLLLICAEVIDSLHLNINLQFSDCDFTVWGNAILLKRAFHNIIENAFKYGASLVTIKLEIKNDSIVTKITNDGDKIDIVSIDQIFQYRFRANNIKADGYGIGLSLVQNIVELHHGSILVESELEYTSFYISVPSMRNTLTRN